MRGKMSKLHIYTICIIIGYTIAAPVSETPTNQLREIRTITEDNPGLVPGDEEESYFPREFIFEIVETKDAAQTKDVFVIDEIVDDDDDMEVAETHLFRPLFRYRAQLEKRKRITGRRS
ncbi:uncharacterized protein LOC119081844 [Bradysia coprophila]|uniref:uncharacterized protein LOC119081844 n=1 Tax=Bradysia coprophila TaxID=38358 RepID=UPI00187DBE4C|nr:uncharacterized protein LOC119081844 [Bradysia coprophila]